MTNVAKIAVASVLALAVAAGVEAIYIHQRNTENASATAQQRGAYEERSLTDDETVAYGLKHLRPSSMKDIRELTGKSVWVSAGGQMDYYKDSGAGRAPRATRGRRPHLGRARPRRGPDDLTYR